MNHVATGHAFADLSICRARQNVTSDTIGLQSLLRQIDSSDSMNFSLCIIEKATGVQIST